MQIESKFDSYESRESVDSEGEEKAPPSRNESEAPYFVLGHFVRATFAEVGFASPSSHRRFWSLGTNLFVADYLLAVRLRTYVEWLAPLDS
jgi:hypothetical protein